MSIEAMKQALEALEFFEKAGLATLPSIDAITSLRQAIEQAEKQEPVAVGSVVKWLDGSLVHGWFGEPPPEGTLLYTHPPKHAWVGLTDEEIWEQGADNVLDVGFARDIEAKLKEKNT